MNLNNHIFVSYKALGFVTNEVPISVGYYRKLKKPFVVTCIGRSFHVYNCDKLAIVNISDSLPEKISCIKTDKQFIHVASGKFIYVFIQWKKVWKILDSHDHNITLMLPFVDHLISIDEESHMKVWTIKDGTLFSEMDLKINEFKATAIMHPRHYVNKLLVGSSQGTMKLINLSQNKTIYSYDGWNSPITVLAQSQAVDVVGVGLKDGRIILHDLKCDETLMTFLQEWGEVTSLAFRTDQSNLMVSGSAMGHIGVWDLEKRSLLSQLNEAHYGPITGLECLQNEPIMLTSSNDNSLKTWIFDLSNGGARLLHQRSGHAKPPTKIRFHGSSGNTILSSGLDSTIRSFSTIHDSSNKSLGRASYNKKQSKKMGLKNDTLVMPPIIDFYSETARQSDWDGLLACHEDESLATTWNYNRGTMGQHKYKPDLSEIHLHPSKKVTAKCVTITSCGNFGIVGYSNGMAEVFNMQSGLSRGSFTDNDMKAAHSQNITGVFVDEVNHHAVTMALDGKIKFWNFKSRAKVGEESFEFAPMKGILQRENNLLAVALSDFSVATIDVETRHIVRQFEGHENDITDMAFAKQGRWLITSCMDCCIRVFDLFSTTLIDIFQLHTPATSIAVSPTDELLATTHANDLGIYLWYNRALHISETLSFNSANASLKPEMVLLPETKCLTESIDNESLEVVEESDIYESPESIEGMLTCSGLPEVRWMSLVHYDTIMKKNKLKGEEREKIEVPFFIPTRPGLEFAFDLDQGQMEKEKDDEKKGIKGWETKVESMLKSFKSKAHESDFAALRDYLLTLTPSGIEFELLALSTSFETDDDVLSCFLQFLEFWAKSSNHVDLYNAILVRFLKVHHEHLSKQHADVIGGMISMLKAKSDTFSNSQNMINCLLSYQKSAAL